MAKADSKTSKKTPDNKLTRVIVPYLYDNPGSTIKEIVDPKTGKPVEALYFYDAIKTGVIEQTDEPVKTGKRGRPARRWKLTKATRDRVRKQRKRAEANAAKTEPVEPVATPEPALA